MNLIAEEMREKLRQLLALTIFFSLLIHFSKNVAFHIESSYLFSTAKQMTGFYMKRNAGMEWVDSSEAPEKRLTKEKLFYIRTCTDRVP